MKKIVVEGKGLGVSNEAAPMNRFLTRIREIAVDLSGGLLGAPPQKILEVQIGAIQQGLPAGRAAAFPLDHGLAAAAAAAARIALVDVSPLGRQRERERERDDTEGEHAQGQEEHAADRSGHAERGCLTRLAGSGGPQRDNRKGSHLIL
jgi:hypothetical protein